MKTFSEFIAEAEVKWNTGTLKGSGMSPSSTAATKLSQLRRQMSNPRNTPQQMSQIAHRFQKIKSKIAGAGEEAKIRDPRTQSKDAGRTNTKIRGYASKSRDVVSRVGTTSDVQRTDLPSEPDVVTQHRYTKKGTAGGRGTNIARSGRTYGTKGRGG
jgi:hypothetical protein